MKLRTLQEISKLKIDENVGAVSYQIELVSIYEDTTRAEIRKRKASDLRRTVRDIENELKNLNKKHEYVTMGTVKLHLKQDHELTLGEYIDIENYSKDALIGHILAVVFRSRTRESDIHNYEYEPYDKVNVNKRSELFMDMEADGLSAVIVATHDLRSKVAESYHNLFAPIEPDTRNEEDLTESEIKMKKAEEIHATFAWQSFVLFLADGDVTKCEAVLALPLFFALNMASYKKSVLPR